MLREAAHAMDVLSRGSHHEAEKTKLCVCCLNQDTQACPHQQGGKAGLCSQYILDERNPLETEERVLLALLG